MPNIIGDEQKQIAGEIKNLMAVYREAEDLINIGAYIRGSNGNIDRAIDKITQINNFLRQETHEKIEMDEVLSAMSSIIS
jgi:flagellum-specific ATP synthase